MLSLNPYVVWPNKRDQKNHPLQCTVVIVYTIQYQTANPVVRRGVHQLKTRILRVCITNLVALSVVRVKVQALLC